MSSTERVLRASSGDASTEGGAVDTDTGDQPVGPASLTCTQGNQTVGVPRAYTRNMVAGEKRTVDLRGDEP